MPEKNSSPAKDNPPPEQDTSAPDIHMDMGAQQDAPDAGTDASGARIANNVGASRKSADIDKGKGPEVLEVRAEPAQTALRQVMPGK
jgi:hypothetical protein